MPVRHEIWIRFLLPPVNEGSGTGVHTDMERRTDVRRAVLVEGISQRQRSPVPDDQLPKLDVGSSNLLARFDARR